MADKKISQLTALTGANTAADDLLAIVDTNAAETKKITREEFFKNIQGSVGIGISSPAAGNKLHIEGGGLRIDSAAGVPALLGAINLGYSAGSAGIKIEGLRVGSNLDQHLLFYTSSTATSGTATERMRIDSSGNVGIGTSSPSQRLHVVGNTRVVGTTRVDADYNVNDFYKANGTTQLGYLLFRDDGPAYIASSSNQPLAFIVNGNNERMRIDSSGNVGLGVTPSAWTTFSSVLQVKQSSLFSNNGNTYFYSNYYFDGSAKYMTNNEAMGYAQENGAHYWFSAPSGTAGNAITFTQALTLDANRNLLLNGTSAGASAVGTLAIFNGTAPTGSVTNGVILYAEDVSSSSELKVRDEAGNVTTLSPHNFSMIPEGASEDMAWAYYSEKNGKKINVDMLKLARMVEKLTGEKLVYEA